MNGLQSSSKTQNIAVFGLGEAGSLLAVDLLAAGNVVTGYDPKAVVTPFGIIRANSASDAVANADIIIALTAGDDASEALEQAITDIPVSTLYADFSTNSAKVKLAMAERAASFAFDFVDVALMTVVPGKGIHTPVMVAGVGASRFEAYFSTFGMPVTRIHGLAGDAATRKLLRSVMMKGLAAVVIESMRAGEAVGCAEWLWKNLCDEIASADTTLIARLVAGTQSHALRRLHEMECSTELLKDLGVEPTMTLATVESLKSVLSKGIPAIPD